MMIPLKETVFDVDDIDGNIMGAGVLPVSVDANGVVRFLLGKERHINNWRGSLKWSGFEGGRKHGERVERTAAREFIEESIGVVDTELLRPTIDSVQHFVEARQYVARIVLCILHGENVERRYHVTYLVQVPYDASYASKFIDRRRWAVDVQSKSAMYAKVRDHACEHLRGLFPIESGVYDGDAVETVTRVDEHDDGSLRVCYLDDNGVAHSRDVVGADAAMRDMYVRWFEAKKSFLRMCDEMERSDAQALNLYKTHYDKNGVPRDAKVNDDFIEKQDIQWWKMDDLRVVIRNGGYVHSEFFRAYFLPVLQRAIQEVDRILGQSEPGFF